MQRTIGLLFSLLVMGTVSAVAASAAPSLAPDPGVGRVLDAYLAARPTESELRVFQLDWSPSLKDAKTRAEQEGRPIFFVSTTQLEDAGDLRGGHC
jgi:hypothetical protein